MSGSFQAGCAHTLDAGSVRGTSGALVRLVLALTLGFMRRSPVKLPLGALMNLCITPHTVTLVALNTFQLSHLRCIPLLSLGEAG